ncbi:MAG: hypothetical protein ACI4IJ_00905 [Acutalibacteraceae bacterium]
MKDMEIVMRAGVIIIIKAPAKHSPGAKSWKRKNYEEKQDIEEEQNNFKFSADLYHIYCGQTAI